MKSKDLPPESNRLGNPNQSDSKKLITSNKPPSADWSISYSLESPKRIGLSLFLVTFGFFGIWASTAPIEGAARAPSVVSVKSYKKIIQHLEGGIVDEIFVQDGDVVNEGDPLLKIDSTQSAARLEVAKKRFVAYKSTEARLIAERDNQDAIIFPTVSSENQSAFEKEINSQTAIFDSRKATFDGRVNVLGKRIEQLNSRIDGLYALRESKKSLAASYKDELQDVLKLLEQGFSNKEQLRNAERNFANYTGEAAELTSQIATVEVQVGETQIEILQLGREKQNEIVEELAGIQTAMSEINEEMTALEDIVTRSLVRAPVGGTVNGMQVHTLGGVIRSGDPIAEIIPIREELILQARVSPNDIDRVFVGQEALIRFSSFGNRTPTIFGNLLHVSADTLADRPDQQPYYLARIEVSADSIEDLGELELIPGMPAEAFIATGSRTLLQYMIKPLTDAAARSFIED